jgi:hypothetical protein
VTDDAEALTTAERIELDAANATAKPLAADWTVAEQIELP